MKPAPVTCLITAYNAAPYIEEAISSLVTQTRPPAEIILVDDGSTDNTADLAQITGGSLLRIIRQENQGMAAGRNRALKEELQPFVMFADADDVSEPDRIERCLDGFASAPECAAIFGNWQNFWIESLADEELSETRAEMKGEQSSRYLCTGLFRSDLVRSVGGFDTSLRLSEVQWVTRATRIATLVHDLGHLTYRRRIHHTNMSRNRTHDDLFEMVQSLRRQSVDGM